MKKIFNSKNFKKFAAQLIVLGCGFYLREYLDMVGIVLMLVAITASYFAGLVDK